MYIRLHYSTGACSLALGLLLLVVIPLVHYSTGALLNQCLLVGSIRDWINTLTALGDCSASTFHFPLNRYHRPRVFYIVFLGVLQSFCFVILILSLSLYHSQPAQA